MTKTYTLSQLEQAFKAGFHNGRHEQFVIDNPEVNVRPPRSVEDYWKKFLEGLNKKG